MNGNYVIGEDTDNLWNDTHICHVYNWLLYNPQSPWYQSPSMLMTAMGLLKIQFRDFKKSAKKGELYLRLPVRLRVTKSLKIIANGEIIPRIEKRNSLGWVRKYTLLPVSNPTPLPIPPFIKAFISIDRNGIKMQFGASTNAPQRRGEKNKLLNPFGV